MKAAVAYEAGQPLVVEEVAVEDPREREVLVRIVAAGVCHSDLGLASGKLPLALPAVLGHEGAGVVERVGPGVTRVQPHDHVVMLWRAACGHCYYCAHGSPTICDLGYTMRATGKMPDGSVRYSAGGRAVNHLNGVSTFAEYSVAPEVCVLRIPPDIRLDRAAIIGCSVLTGVGAVLNAADVRPGSSVAVIGCGGVGLNVIQGSVVAGAERIIAIDTSQPKLHLARDFGATHVIDATAEDGVEAVRQVTGGRGSDFTFEAVGSVPTLRQALEATRRGGVAVAIGMPAVDAALELRPLPELINTDKTLRGSIYGSSNFAVDVPRILSLYRAGRLKLDELITGTYGLGEVNEALDMLHGGTVARSVILMDDPSQGA